MISVRPPLAIMALTSGLACTSESPEAQVKRAFEDCVRALEGGEAARALDVLAPGFEGPESMDRNAARLYLMGLLRRERLGITVLRNRIEAGEREATQEITVLVTQRGGQSLLPDEGSRQDFLIRWEHRKGEWRVRSLKAVQPEGR